VSNDTTIIVEEKNDARFSKSLRPEIGFRVGEKNISGDDTPPSSRKRRAHRVADQVGQLEDIRLGDRAGAGLESILVPRPFAWIILSLVILLANDREIRGEIEREASPCWLARRLLDDVEPENCVGRCIERGTCAVGPARSNASSSRNAPSS
jgi:hypothetical protein